MTRILIVGAGGHGQVVADALLRARAAGSTQEPIGFLDDDSSLIHSEILGLRVLGGLEQRLRIPHDAVVVAIGHNGTRAELSTALSRDGVRFASAIHPSAIIAPDVRLGQGVVICAGVVISTGATVGDGAILNTACTVDHHSVVEAQAHVGPGAHFGAGVIVGEGALIGVGAAILPGCRIGEWATVGAGSVVLRDVGARTTVAGVPARPLTARRSSPS